MAIWRFVLLFTLAFGSVLPHCAAAMPVSATAPHHIGMAHDDAPPTRGHVTDACIGCATPVRFAFAEPAAPITVTRVYIGLSTALRSLPTALDPPPPRQAA
jgi:hypothetical protein